MKHHTKIYMDFFGFKIPEDAICEMPGCGLPCVDINHIDARGMGGNPSGDKDHIENLIGMCRGHHIKHGDVPDDKPMLRKIHNDYIMLNGKVDKMIEHGILGEADLKNDI